MANLHLIKELCKQRGISLSELSERSGVSYTGITRILRTNNTTIESLEKISKILKVSPAAFLYKENYGGNMTITLNNDLVTMLCNRYDSYFEKINTLKDYYIWKHVNFIIRENRNYPGKDIKLAFPIRYKGGPETLLTLEQTMQIEGVISLSDISIPYSKWPSTMQGLIKTTHMLEGFYFILFTDNIFQIKNLMTDGLISNTEIKKYWEKWKSVTLIE